MHGKEEVEKLEMIANEVCKVLNIAYPRVSISGKYTDDTILFTMKTEYYSQEFPVNVACSSVQAGITDIAKQFLSLPLYDSF